MRSILALMYMRTLLMIVSDDLTPTMRKIMQKCTDTERRLYRSNKGLYLQCVDIAKTTWPLVKDGKTDYSIEVEPVVCALYYSVEKELIKLKFKRTHIDKLYDKYFHTSKCELENKSRMLSDEIWKVTNKVMEERTNNDVSKIL